MLEINLTNKAISQTTQAYNSMCRFGGEHLGATDTGLFRMTGYNDHGVQIPALIKSGMMDFGIAGKKRFRFFYFGLDATGSLKLSVYCDNALAGQYTVESATGTMNVRVPISRALQGRYWSWSVENVNGSFFALYSVEALPVILLPIRP